ncbi:MULTISPECIES: TIGR02186 family protein [Asticcacaulis]|jgi:uncharacterized protein (TIGR02186 family)|uniref:Transmembrane protein (Alph_Pro_TM) n=1 Tax=Asticcacaulis endophyticus TaxID=1395890 RepID=A0A918UR86_9CAUL|nr:MULTISPECIES: TIGR02186 family protein [Asticcacaulis]WAC49905.1 TIGR02186 family protein [Asticcacaulis sp. SL142]WKL58851.1 TIGR02186 family protein [Asticcacaulis sp. ZE23SCel15]GGZ27842.1 hypothetical protein GCM10011273_11940 [Asticcacaulis endophyticus]
MVAVLPPAIPPAIVQALPEAAPSSNILSTDLTQNRIEVSSSFQGAKVVVYGAVVESRDQPSDVVVVVSGPKASMRLIRKVQVAGLWLNSRPVVFEGAPGFYMAASSQPLDRITGFSNRRRLGLGVDYIAMDTPRDTKVVTRYGVRDVVVNSLEDDYLEWRQAVTRLKQKSSLYSDNPFGVRFVDRNLFRAEIDLPSDAPIGTYKAEVWLFRDGEPVSYSAKLLRVEKVGFERFIYDTAHRRPWMYGIVSALICIGLGLGASRIFQRR